MEDGSKGADDSTRQSEESEHPIPDRQHRSAWDRFRSLFTGAGDVTQEDIRSIVTEGQEQGVLKASEADMISNIFEFSDKEAQDIMTHRVEIVAVDGNMPLRDAVRFMLEGNNSRFPVYLENIDHIIGILNIRDAMKSLYEGGSDDVPLRKTKGLLRTPRFVPETRHIDKLFRSMQQTKTQMVIVIDEYGQTAGLLSMEDILEEIVGNIQDEYDEDEIYIEPTGNSGEFLIDGRTKLEELEKRFRITFGETNFETLNGFMISKLNRIPEDGEEIDFSVTVEGLEFRIKKVHGHRVESVLVKKLPEPEAPTEEKKEKE
ncbi:MAG: hemolysin family protein [Lachnospiraceae bacterium]|nr:hemolysin family protein [Lachnospiraceae bacterium]